MSSEILLLANVMCILGFFIKPLSLTKTTEDTGMVYQKKKLNTVKIVYKQVLLKAVYDIINIFSVLTVLCFINYDFYYYVNG